MKTCECENCDVLRKDITELKLLVRGLAGALRAHARPDGRLPNESATEMQQRLILVERLLGHAEEVLP